MTVLVGHRDLTGAIPRARRYPGHRTERPQYALRRLLKVLSQGPDELRSSVCDDGGARRVFMFLQ